MLQIYRVVDAEVNARRIICLGSPVTFVGKETHSKPLFLTLIRKRRRLFLMKDTKRHNLTCGRLVWCFTSCNHLPPNFCLLHLLIGLGVIYMPTLLWRFCPLRLQNDNGCAARRIWVSRMGWDLKWGKGLCRQTVGEEGRSTHHIVAITLGSPKREKDKRPWRISMWSTITLACGASCSTS